MLGEVAIRGLCGAERAHELVRPEGERGCALCFDFVIPSEIAHTTGLRRLIGWNSVPRVDPGANPMSAFGELIRGAGRVSDAGPISYTSVQSVSSLANTITLNRGQTSSS